MKKKFRSVFRRVKGRIAYKNKKRKEYETWKRKKNLQRFKRTGIPSYVKPRSMTTDYYKIPQFRKK